MASQGDAKTWTLRKVMTRLRRTHPEGGQGYAHSWTLRYAGVILGVGAVGATLIAVASLTFLPRTWGSESIADAPDDATAEQQLAVDVAKNDAEAEVRDLGLRIALGFGVISGALVAYGRLQLTRGDSERSDKASERSDKAQANERWTTAVGQLGNERVEVRLGGVYALEQFYGDVPEERVRTTSVLAAFVRANLPPNKLLPEVPEGQRPAPLPPDIQAALTAIGGLSKMGSTDVQVDLSRVDTYVDGRYKADVRGADLSGATLRGATLTFATLTDATVVDANLSRADLHRADLSDANLRGATLFGATLSFANLSGANLSFANLIRAALTGADLTDAHLYCAALTEAHLSGAHVSDADLSGADLSGADLTNADLTGADLTNANLRGADLTGTTLLGAELSRVRFNKRTVWPKGFTPPDE